MPPLLRPAYASIDLSISWTLTIFMYFSGVKVDESISTVANERKYEGVDCGGNMGLVECGGWTILDVPTNGSRTTHTRLPNGEVYHQR